jgi:hypothetical protein
LNHQQLEHLEDLAHRLEDLQFEIHGLLDAEQDEANEDRSPAAIDVLASALSHVGFAVARLDSLMPASSEQENGESSRLARRDSEDPSGG